MKQAASLLTRAFLSGPLEVAGMLERLSQYTSPKHHTALEKVATRVTTHFGQGTRPPQRKLEAFLLDDKEFEHWFRRFKNSPLEFAPPEDFPPVMCPASGAPNSWQVFPLPTESDIATWLGLTYGELMWFANYYRPAPAESRLHHYTYEWRTKKSGGKRLLEKPKEALKLYQRKLLRDVLAPLPPHRAVHSFLPDRSVVSFVQPHVGQEVVLRMDLEDFFPSLTSPRVEALFRTVGYPDAAANTLTRLVCHPTPSSVIAEAGQTLTSRAKARLYQRHLPQGAPTSPALSNLLFYRLDTRLAGLAKSVGGHYTRYADDLAFSGNKHVSRIATGLIPQVSAIAHDEGLSINFRKTRLMRANQRQYLGGQVINRHPNIRRRDYDKLKATLHNAGVHGPETQFHQNELKKRQQQLQGQIAWVAMVNTARGKRLQHLYNQITWPNS